MESIFRDVKSIQSDERRVYESLVGHALGDNQCVVIRVIELAAEPGEGPRLPPMEWSKDKNKRRRDLIDKQIEGTLSAEEWLELDELQDAAMAYRDQRAPLPMEGARRLHRELLAQKRRSEAKE